MSKKLININITPVVFEKEQTKTEIPILSGFKVLNINISPVIFETDITSHVESVPLTHRLFNINIKPIIYSKNLNGEYIKDTNNNLLVEKNWNEISPIEVYDYSITYTDDTTVTRIPDIYDSTILSAATSALDYRVWTAYWQGYQMWNNGNIYDFTNLNYPYKSIVPMVLVPYNADSGYVAYNGQRYPLVAGTTPNTNYTPSSSLWETFKTRINTIPFSRRVIMGSYWYADMNYYTKGVVDYYKNVSRDGTLWQGTAFLTPWVETNMNDAKLSYQTFLNKCKTDNIIFNYFADDREQQQFFYLNGIHTDNTSGGTPRAFGSQSCGHIIPDGGTCINNTWISGGRLVQDARYISAIINDIRFTTKINPKTGMTFAQEFIHHFINLWQNHWYFKNIPLPNPMPSYTEILSPWLNITVNNDFKRTTNYWRFYGCTPNDRDIPNRVPCSGTSGNCGPFGTYKSLQPINYNDTNKLTGYALFHFAIPAWNATFENWMYGHYIFEQIQATHMLPENSVFNNSKHIQYQHSAVNAEEASYFQQSNLDPDYLDVIEHEMYGPAFYGYIGNVEYVNDYVPIYKQTPPNGHSTIEWANTHSYRSGYVKNPKSDYEKYSWSGYGDIPYGGASCNTNNLIRYPETSMVDGLNNWIPENHQKFMTELSYKTLIKEIKQLRHIVRSNDNYTQQLVPWFTGPNWSTQCIYGYYNYGYWVESMFHMLLHNPANIMYWGPFYGPKLGKQVRLGQEDAVHFVLDKFRTITKNLEIEACSNLNADTAQKVDRIILEDVFEKYLISGCRIKNSDVYLWRISVPPKYFDPITGIATLTKKNQYQKDIPTTIQINSNYDIMPTESWETENIHNSRGVWLIRRSPIVPEYIPNPI